MKHLMLYRALGNFLDVWGYAVAEEFENWGEVKELKEKFSGKYPKYNVETLKSDIRSAMLEDDCYWISLNQDEDEELEDGEGFHFVAMHCWGKVYPEANMYLRFTDDYHFTMLKLLVKKCIWDIFWPDEELVEYEQPRSGMLPHFKKS
jgi:hypothetical protein